MFHVVPMLIPNCRSRLVGNDIVGIVWLEDGVWNPSSIVSQVLHAYVVVRPIHLPNKPPQFRVHCVAKDGLPLASPKTDNQLFQLDEKLRNFVLRKSVNLERAAWQCPTTVRSQTRSLQEHLFLTREGQLGFIYERYYAEGKEY
uniref:Rap-GAP domain-containing protein n=1 Tax=Arcella intermedia TaxID=1963864 RepID=A0A6B2LIC4_9EUKA